MAELTSIPRVTPSQCRCLRSKEMYINVEPDLSMPHSGSGIFWCAHTQNCLGPDGKVAGEENCRPGRSCFEPV
jgi:hypothetical protein